MNWTNLKMASDHEVENWLISQIPSVTPYQREAIHDREVIRYAPYYFYSQRKKEKVTPFWRLTLLFVPFGFLFMVIGLPVKFLLTGQWRYSPKSKIVQAYAAWMRKLNLENL